MDKTCKIMYLKDLVEGSMANELEILKNSNLKLYEVLMANLRKDSSLGIREDILRYMSGNVEGFRKDQEYIHNIVGLVSNIKVIPECVEWVNSYFANDTKMDINDFIIVLNEAIEKDIPLAVIKEMFSAEQADILEIYQKVEEYIQPQPELVDEKPVELPEIEESIVVEPVSVDVEPQKEENEYGDVVASLLTVMTNKNSDTAPILTAQENMNKFLSEFQSAFNKLSVYTAEVIREWEKDKEENERLQALIKLQQKMMLNQQRKINELRNENVQLNERIQVAARAEMQIQAISQKLTEFQTMPSDAQSVYGTSYITGR